MRFLADESCDFAVVRSLRAAGHDVVAVAEIAASVADEEVIRLAQREDRILLTEDKDFGQWVYANRAMRGGVVLMRYPAGARQELASAVVQIIQAHGERLATAFTVIGPGRMRIRKPPED